MESTAYRLKQSLKIFWENATGFTCAVLLIFVWFEFFYQPPFPKSIIDVRLGDIYRFTGDRAILVQSISVISTYSGITQLDPVGYVCGTVYVQTYRFWMKRLPSCTSFEKITEFHEKLDLRDKIYVEGFYYE